jgi:hypothetical protein
VIPEFRAWPKIARLRRPVVITEKIDGTNACVYVPEDPAAPLVAGKRTSWIFPGPTDNHGFAAWVQDHADELRTLGPGTHFGEWWGPRIGKRYPTATENQFSLFNTERWDDNGPIARPSCCGVVPVLTTLSRIDDSTIESVLIILRTSGSVAAPGCKAEGVVVFHTASRVAYKVTLEKDDEWKGSTEGSG